MQNVILSRTFQHLYTTDAVIWQMHCALPTAAPNRNRFLKIKTKFANGFARYGFQLAVQIIQFFPQLISAWRFLAIRHSTKKFLVTQIQENVFANSYNNTGCPRNSSQSGEKNFLFECFRYSAVACRTFSQFGNKKIFLKRVKNQVCRRGEILPSLEGTNTFFSQRFQRVAVAWRTSSPSGNKNLFLSTCSNIVKWHVGYFCTPETQIAGTRH